MQTSFKKNIHHEFMHYNTISTLRELLTLKAVYKEEWGKISQPLTYELNPFRKDVHKSKSS